VQLQSGDVLVLVTDGVIEEQNHAREHYGEARLKKLIEKLDTSRFSAKKLRRRSFRTSNAFHGLPNKMMI
jgi:serine phosphatase RsbU (regulator of sigma subunit)